MKRLVIIFLLLLTVASTLNAQENHGRTLNVGVGIGGYSGYYRYVGRSLPVLHIDYEFNAGRNFTLAPFANFFTYSNKYYWGNNSTPRARYTYRETVIPIGIKGTYYFDDIFQAGPNWDFYAAGSLGFAIVRRQWEDGYLGDTNYYKGGNSLFLDVHIGAEYHVNDQTGFYLDISSGVGSLGIAFHSVR